MKVMTSEPTLMDLQKIEVETKDRNRAREQAIKAFAWQDRAACEGANQDLFFPERGNSTSQAKVICLGSILTGLGPCLVRKECLVYALTVPERFGIWGGYSEHERRRLRLHVALSRNSIETVVNRVLSGRMVV